MTPALAVYTGLILARVGAFVAVAPPFNGQAPRLVRVGFALALAAFYLGVVSPSWDQALAAKAADVHPAVYAVALVREALIGMAMGFAFALFLLPARVAGEFITQQVGLSVSPSVGPTGTDSAGQIARVFETLAAMLFLVADGHHLALAALHGSFAQLPLGGTAVPTAGPLLDGLASSYEMGLLLGGPLALCLFLLSVTLAIMTRAAPQLNIYSVGFSLQVLVVLLGGLFLLPEIVRTMTVITARTGVALPYMLGG